MKDHFCRSKQSNIGNFTGLRDLWLVEQLDSILPSLANIQFLFLCGSRRFQEGPLKARQILK